MLNSIYKVIAILQFIYFLQVIGVTESDIYFGMGQHFVGFVGQYGYDRVLSVLGRHVRDFLNGMFYYLLFKLFDTLMFF